MRGMVESFDAGMEPQKASGSQGWRVVAMPTGNWTVPRDGLYRIHSWGAGAGANGAVGGGLGGAYQQKTVRLKKNDTLTIVIGACAVSGATTATTVVGPGFSMNSGTSSMGSSTRPAPTGGDLNIPSVDTTAASSPDGIYKGGTAGPDQGGGKSPGGASTASSGTATQPGAGGMVIIEEYV